MEFHLNNPSSKYVKTIVYEDDTKEHRMEIKTDKIYTSIKELPFSVKKRPAVRDAIAAELKREEEHSRQENRIQKETKVILQQKNKLLQEYILTLKHK